MLCMLYTKSYRQSYRHTELPHCEIIWYRRLHCVKLYGIEDFIV